MNDLAIVYDALGQQWALAERIARTNFVPAPMRGKPEEVLACILTGQELGIGPMQALRHIHVIQGRPTLSAELMASRVRAAGHRIRTIESTDTQATVEGARSDDPEAPEKVTWTIDDAKRANLLGKDNWKQYPAAMLWARAVSALCRRLFGDVLGGISYTEEEAPGSTEVAWGEPMVDRETGEVLEEPAAGVVTMTPTPAVAATPSMPTLEQIKKLRDPGEARDLLWLAPQEYQQAVKTFVSGGDEKAWKQFWKTAPLTRWQAAMTDAINILSNQMSPAPAAPLLGAGDPTSGAGRAGHAEVSGDTTREGTADPAMTPAPDSPALLPREDG